VREVKRAMDTIIEHAEKASKGINDEQVDDLISAILNSKRIFVIGAGRSGLMIKAFAMRLMHLGIDVHVIGETITPALREGDLLLGVSGSGETSLVVSSAKIAKNLNAKIAVVTSYPGSTLAKLADHVVTLPGRVEVAETKSYIDRQIAGEYESLTPMGTLFEVAAMVFLDGVIAGLMKKLGKKEEDLNARHATIE